MGSDVPGKLLVFIAVVIAGVLMFAYDPGGNLSYALWGLAVTLLVLGLINWGVR